MFGGMQTLRGGGTTKVTTINKYDRLYAIGDVHGCNKELCAILDHLKNVEKFTKDDQLIMIGDYIDRGPDSPGVIETLIQFKKDFPKTEFLRGNHEDMLIGHLYGYTQENEGMYGNMFHYNGGNKTQEQYEEMFCKWDNLLEIIPSEHEEFILSTKGIIKTPDAIFVHAGINPYHSIYDQCFEYTVWDRDHRYVPGVRVIHGHTPYSHIKWCKEVHPEYEDFRGDIIPAEEEDIINIDTGCAYDKTQRLDIGRLTCLNVKDMVTFSVRKGETSIHHLNSEQLKEGHWFTE